jgi:hypothetical protein
LPYGVLASPLVVGCVAETSCFTNAPQHNKAMSITADGAANSKEKELDGEAVLDARTNKALAALGLAPVALGGLGRPEMTLQESFLLSEHVCGLVKRAGLLEAFRALLINDVVEGSDVTLGRILGCPIAPGGTGQYAVAYPVLPEGLPRIESSELAGRELAKRLVASEAIRQGAEQ